MAERAVLQESTPRQHKESGDASVSLKMGLPTYDDFDANGSLKHIHHASLSGQKRRRKI